MGLVMCGGACVSWFSRTQIFITLSTTEEEYLAVADVVEEELFLRTVWRFMLLDDVGVACIPVFEDIIRVRCSLRRILSPTTPTLSILTHGTISPGNW